MSLLFANSDAKFDSFLQELPTDYADLAREFKAVGRSRKIKTPAQLLQAVMAGRLVKETTATDRHLPVQMHNQHRCLLNGYHLTGLAVNSAGVLKIWLMVLAAIGFISLQTTAAQAGQVSLAWMASTGPVGGYRIYFGQSSGNYTANLDVGARTAYTVTDLLDGYTYYFAVKAYDITRTIESGFSNEVSMSTTCPYDDHRVLQHATVTGTALYGACRTLAAGPGFVVSASGDATFRAGQRITLRPGFAVRAGGRFRAQIDSTSLATAAAATAAAPRARHAAPAAAPESAAPPWPPATALTWRELPAGLQARLREHDATVRDAQQSADGTVIVFATETALVWNDANEHSDIYRYDPHLDALTLVSVGRSGRAADGPSHSPRLDGEGRHVIYLSTAGDLVAEPGNEHAQIYHHDLGFGRTARLTRTGAGRPGAGASEHPLLAGPWAIYRTEAPDLAPEGPGLYRQHLPDGRREAVGLDDGGQPDPRASHPTADAAGDQIAYQRPDPDERRQIYLTALPWVERLSRADDPDLGPLDHCCAALSADGRYLAYREQGTAGPAWLHLRDRDGDRYVRLPWPADEALAEHAPVFRNEDRELWWLAPEQGPELPEVRHRLANPLLDPDAR